MKSHGIAPGSLGGGGGGGGAAASSAPSTPSTPKTPKTPAGRKKLPTSRGSSVKKRKLAATGDDLDDDGDVVKSEVKEEPPQIGSYTMHPTTPHFDATAAATNLGKACRSNLGGEVREIEEDDALIVAETYPGHGVPTLVPFAASMALVHQMVLPPPPEYIYELVDPSYQQPPLLNTTALAAPSAPLFHHDHDTDCLPQARMTTSEQLHTTAQWLQQQSLYWGVESGTEMEAKSECPRH